MVEGKTREETIRLTAEALGVSLLQAGFIVAQELGEIDGDVIMVDDDGNEVREPAADQVKPDSRETPPAE